jgi:hypothetical protein
VLSSHVRCPPSNHADYHEQPAPEEVTMAKKTRKRRSRKKKAANHGKRPNAS